ncbi:hypothetical protein ABH931_006995 [Streptacidiphilus sp. MAP12-33]
MLSPAVLADLTGFPPLLIQVGTNEILLDDSTRLAARARAVGVDVILDVTADVPHVFQAFAGTLDQADEALDRAALFRTPARPRPGQSGHGGRAGVIPALLRPGRPPQAGSRHIPPRPLAPERHDRRTPRHRVVVAAATVRPQSFGRAASQSVSSSLTSAGRSCWIQWPQPSSR